MDLTRKTFREMEFAKKNWHVEALVTQHRVSSLNCANTVCGLCESCEFSGKAYDVLVFHSMGESASSDWNCVKE